MLDNETKKKIDDLRQILVGKVTDPRSQVEQITNALLYKFMNDMDQDSISLGGVPSYFINEYEKYSWKNLFNKKISGDEKVKIYTDGLEKMYFNENLPTTFREIFKNSTLPFKDSKIFNKFINVINDFKYSNSENLGDAFEYLLSFMGKQGDAGQFRTPRHIIDFIVEIIDPKKNETILDPSSGTAGFLISAYKNILNKNTKKVPGDLLNASDRKNINKNLNGYDISPEFLKVSLMNMFLHKFNSPNIHEYDTLSSEERWSEYYDVVLANPPFFTPKGGITPHNRFSIKSKRAEVLFTDYIDDHLKPKGRAGIIVPEGILFKTDTGYTALRKKLIKNSLIGVISLPQGVFEPYSRTKTNILILDKIKSKKENYIFFAKVENDGFDLGSTRRKIEKNDLPEILKNIKNNGGLKNNNNFCLVKKEIILEDAKSLLNVSNFVNLESKKYINSKLHPIIDYFRTISPKKKIKKSEFKSIGKIPIIDQSDNFIGGYWNDEKDAILPENPYIIFGDHTRNIKYIDFKFVAGADGTKILSPKKDKILPRFFYYILRSSKIDSLGYSRHFKELKKLKIPVPDMTSQVELVNELDNYQKVIDGCNDVISNYKPILDVKSKWKISKLKEIAKFTYGVGKSAQEKGKYRYIRITDIDKHGLLKETDKKYIDINNEEKKYILKSEDILIARTGATFGKCLYFDSNEPSVYAGYLIKIQIDQSLILPKFFWIFTQSELYDQQKSKLVKGTGQQQFNANTIEELSIPCPSIEEQNEIIQSVKKQQELVNGNKVLIKDFEKRINSKIMSMF
tara:strand:+ start:167 stop:2554 length:2388 start_codon:yes stop_codon:yes gene_type:complete